MTCAYRKSKSATQCIFDSENRSHFRPNCVFLHYFAKRGLHFVSFGAQFDSWTVIFSPPKEGLSVSQGKEGNIRKQDFCTDLFHLHKQLQNAKRRSCARNIDKLSAALSSKVFQAPTTTGLQVKVGRKNIVDMSKTRPKPAIVVVRSRIHVLHAADIFGHIFRLTTYPPIRACVPLTTSPFRSELAKARFR